MPRQTYPQSISADGFESEKELITVKMMLPRICIALTSLLVALASETSIPEIDKCTTIVVGKKAGTDGPMTTHTADCSDCDFRVSKVTFSHFSIISSSTLHP